MRTYAAYAAEAEHSGAKGIVDAVVADMSTDITALKAQHALDLAHTREASYAEGFAAGKQAAGRVPDAMEIRRDASGLPVEVVNADGRRRLVLRDERGLLVGLAEVST